MQRPVLLAGAMTVLLSTGLAHAQDPAARGRYLTAAADCAACHTDPDHPDRKFGGGRAIETPFGELIAPNITSDQDTGIGGWSDAQFDAAVRHGVRADGKRLYPGMPFVYYTRMSADDVAAIHAYLRTVTPVRNVVSADHLWFPLSVRAVMYLWDALFFTPGEFTPDASQSAKWNRGAYLVLGPGHCGACHTPKNLFGADSRDRTFYGYAIQGWFSPDLTENADRGLADWTPEDIVDYLRSGHNRLAAASGPMAEEVALSSSQMSGDDLRAIAAYLKTVSGQANRAPPLARTNPDMLAGAAIYTDLCSGCHAANGHGVPALIPDLVGSGSVASRSPLTVLRVLLQGAPTVATGDEPTGPAMPAFGRRLNDAQLAAIATYIRNSWGHSAASVSVGDVKRARAQLQSGSGRSGGQE